MHGARHLERARIADLIDSWIIAQDPLRWPWLAAFVRHHPTSPNVAHAGLRTLRPSARIELDLRKKLRSCDIRQPRYEANLPAVDLSDDRSVVALAIQTAVYSLTKTRTLIPCHDCPLARVG